MINCRHCITLILLDTLHMRTPGTGGTRIPHFLEWGYRTPHFLGV